MLTTTASLETGIPTVPSEIQEITCYKNGDHWYISLAHFVASKGRQVCTEVAAFTDDLLGWLARRRRATLLLHTQPFAGARMLELEQLCTGPEGGAYYRIASGSNSEGRRLWVCVTSLLAFGDLPPRIFLKFAKKL